MKPIYKYILPLLATVILASCDKTIKVKVPEIKEGLTLFSNTETGTQMAVVVGKSMSILKYNRKQELFVKDATVKLYADGVLTETLKYNDGLQFYLSEGIVEEGKHYKLVVEAPGYATIEAEADAPQRVPLILESVVDTTMPSRFGGFTMATAVKIKFDDPAATVDYYQLNFYSADQLIFSPQPEPSHECLNIQDPSIDGQLDVINGESCVNGDIVFNDVLFNGRSKYITSSVSPYVLFPQPNGGGDSVYPVFKLNRISEARYRYLQSYKKAQESDGNPFAEPVNVYSNVKNGHGIFSISNPAFVQIKYK